MPCAARALPALAPVLVAAPGCIPVLSPPGRADVGFGVRAAARAPETDRPRDPKKPLAAGPVAPEQNTAGALVGKVAVGAHLASAFPHVALPIDAGVGYVFTDVGLGDRTLHGFYAEVTPIANAGSWWRVLAGVHAEGQLADRDTKKPGMTLLGRVGVEAYDSVAVTGGSGKALAVGGARGQYSYGAFVEAGAHRLPGGEEALLFVVGASFRFPASAGVLLPFR